MHFFNTRMTLFYMWAKGDKKKTFFNRIYRRTTECGKQTKKPRERKRRINLNILIK